jgi:signal transduction histidine kinase
VRPDPSAANSGSDLERAAAAEPNPQQSPAREARREEPRAALNQDGLHVAHDWGDARELATHVLVSSARHELRSPLQSIQGFAELLATESYGTLGKDQRVFIEHIIQSTLDLSRALDACFDLIQIELLHYPSAPGRTALQSALVTAVTIAQGSCERPIEVQLSQLDGEIAAELDSVSFQKAIGAIFTAIAPLLRGPIVLSAIRRGDNVEVSFGPDGDDGRAVFRDLQALTRRSSSPRALLWLRLACALLGKSGARIEATDAYERVRIIIPLALGGT